MSRMLAFRAEGASTIPHDIADRFLRQARIHADGWGFAGVGMDDDALRGLVGLEDAAGGIPFATPARAALSYLRFASQGAAVVTENLQPFTDRGVAFMHNGALVPRARALDELTPDERAGLHGTTDSEVYFALVRRALAVDAGTIADRLHTAMAQMRRLYPEACLNAMVLTTDALAVISSRGSVPPPAAALAARGAPAPDADYNVMYRYEFAPGAHVVASSGVQSRAWTAVPDDTVTVFTPGGRPVCR